ncbi:MAG: cation diffusion facilitator family transporter [Acidimicrobiales bacterium]|nr:cation diffusion facilitator family transporter [Acidimicrobiales bacterium]
MSASGGTKAIIAALLANLGIAIAKFIGFLVTGASSMLAESVHSIADSGNQALLLLGNKRARKSESEDRAFGYGRERYFWAFVVALVLFSLGSLFAIYEGIHKIQHPEELDSIGWAIGILLLGIVLEGGSFRTAIVEARRVKGNVRWSTYIRRSRSPEIPVVLLEDFGALIGLVLALTAIITAHVTEEPVWDGIGTLSIGILLGIIAIVLAVEMKSLIIGEGAVPEQLQALRDACQEAPEVTRLIHMRTQHVGPDELLVAAKVAFTPGLPTTEVADAIDALEARMRAAVPIAEWIYIEPDLYEDGHIGHTERDDASDGDHH